MRLMELELRVLVVALCSRNESECACAQKPTHTHTPCMSWSSVDGFNNRFVNPACAHLETIHGRTDVFSKTHTKTQTHTHTYTHIRSHSHWDLARAHFYRSSEHNERAKHKEPQTKVKSIEITCVFAFECASYVCERAYSKPGIAHRVACPRRRRRRRRTSPSLAGACRNAKCGDNVLSARLVQSTQPHTQRRQTSAATTASQRRVAHSSDDCAVADRRTPRHRQKKRNTNNTKIHKSV